MEYSFGSLWDDVPAPLTAEALRREAAACPVCRGTKWITTVGGNYPCDECHQTGQVPDGHVVRSSRKTAEAAPEGSKIKKVGDEWVLYHPNGREIARSKDKKLLTDYRDDKTSAKVATRIRVTQNCQNDEGYLFWAGEEFEAMSGGPYDYGVEVKTRGDYTSIPPGNFEVVGSKTAAKPKGNRAPDEPNVGDTVRLDNGRTVKVTDFDEKDGEDIVVGEIISGNQDDEPGDTVWFRPSQVVGSKTAAKPKGNRAPDEPTQQPMRPTNQIRQSPSADQIKARKQMSRKQAAEQVPADIAAANKVGTEADYQRGLRDAQSGKGGAGSYPGESAAYVMGLTYGSMAQGAFSNGFTPPTWESVKASLEAQGLTARKQMARKQAARSTDCEGHDEAGQCDQSCVEFTRNAIYEDKIAPRMRSQDSSGTSYTDADYEPLPTMPTVTLDPVAKAVRVHATKESAMRTEAQILREMAVASLADQRVLAQELDTLRHQRSAALQADRDLDLADTIVRAHLTPVRVHAMHTVATDWVDTEEPQGDPTLAMKTEATLWFQRTSAEVRDDLEEFAIQAQGKATQLASRHGEQADVAFEAFIGHVDHLYRQSAKVAAEGPSKAIDKDQQSGNAQSGLPLEVDDDETAFDDPGFLNDDEDHGVHPKMPGAGQTASLHTAGDVPQAFKDQWGKGNNDDDDPKNDTPANLGKTDGDPAQVDTYDNDDDDDKKTSRRHTAAEGQTCADCGAAIEHDPANEDPSTWHHNDGSSHDHEATPKSASKTAAEDWKCETCGKDAPIMKATRGEDPRFACYDHEDDLKKPKKEASRRVADARSSEENKASQNGDANSSLPEPDDTKPYLEEDWKGNNPDQVDTGTGAADVANAKNPNDHSKSSMLDKAAAFRATVQANLAKI